MGECQVGDAALGKGIDSVDSPVEDVSALDAWGYGQLIGGFFDVCPRLRAPDTSNSIVRFRDFIQVIELSINGSPAGFTLPWEIVNAETCSMVSGL
jgi:hypothetical protein